MIKFLIEKEFKQLLRNSFLPKMILIFPCMIMILMPWAANLEIKNINLNIVDNDHSVLSRRLVDKIGASTYFRTTALPDTYNEGLRSIEIGSADIILEIPRDFEKNWVTATTPASTSDSVFQYTPVLRVFSFCRSSKEGSHDVNNAVTPHNI